MFNSRNRSFAAGVVLVASLAAVVLSIPISGQSIGSAAYSLIMDEGVALTRQQTVDFVGAGVTATNGPGKTVVTIPGGSASGYQTVQDEGVALTQRTVINFTGSAVACADDAMNTRTNCNVTGGGGGGGGASVIPFASLPAASTAGLLYMFSDSLYTAIDGGASYSYFLGSTPALPPPSTGWTNLNIGSAVVTSSGGYRRVFEGPTTAGQIRGQFRALPTVPYDIKIAFSGTSWTSNTISGLGWYSSGSGALTYIYPALGAALQIQKWNSVSSVSGDYSGWGPKQGNIMNQPFWIRLVDDNTNRLVYLSENGLDWYLVFSVARTDFQTPDSFFFGVASFSTLLDVSFSLLSYQP